MADAFDERLKASLRKATEPASRMQEDVWSRIAERIAAEPSDREEAVKAQAAPPVRRRRLRRAAVVSAAAVLTLGAFLAAAPPGRALVAEVKSWFAPQKTVEEPLEGQPETTEVELQEGAAGYVIYFDEARFRMDRVDGVDRIVPVEAPGPAYPEVYMEISHTAGAPADVAKALAASVEREPTVLGPRKVEFPTGGWEIYAVGGTGGLAWNDPVVRYLAIDDGAGGAFVAKQKYFLEAEEGYGARFQLMMKEFYITENP
ncbi:hypothetical protein [Paenibacillus sp.]|uniref:hypothetical protein n=1 Tax=Paenibacillus sp. TaxID=58172 RepID=UPI0028113751|nr:hypothetical protein [Paenibacillus sp.]